MKQKVYEYDVIDTEAGYAVDHARTRKEARSIMKSNKQTFEGQKFAIIQRKYALTIERKVR